jgi:EAL domain-containing protein (putative c-di-GMP-specific phosphodiesterase class I)
MRAGDGVIGSFDATRVLAAARAAGLTLQLDSHACHTAVSEASRHRISTKLFVNVTPSSLCDAGHGVAEAVRALEELRLSPHQIVFEMVECEPVTDWRMLRKVLERYRECGFQFALDDFGAAYSSPVTLSELRPEYVKLDRALIRGVQSDPGRSSLAGRLLEAGRAFGAKIIAEGVETVGEYHWVLEQGVEYAQGFYISRPATPPPFMHVV